MKVTQSCLTLCDPGKNTGVGSCSLFQEILLTQEPGSPALQVDSLPAQLPGNIIFKSWKNTILVHFGGKIKVMYVQT